MGYGSVDCAQVRLTGVPPGVLPHVRQQRNGSGYKDADDEVEHSYYNTQDLLHRCDPLPHLLESVLPHRDHSLSDRRFPDLARRSTAEDKPADGLAHHEQLEDPRAPSVPCATAPYATRRAVNLDAVLAGAMGKSGAASRSSAAPASRGHRQWGQRMRTKRWATTPTRVEAVRKGSMPISPRRVIAPAASFVWSVEKTRWPVSADSTAI